MNLNTTIAPFRVEWNQLDKAAWEHALLNAEYSAYQQHWAYGEALKAFGGNIARAAVYYDDSLIGLLQLQYRKWFKLLHLAIAMRGPVWLDDIEDTMRAEVFNTIRKTHTIPFPAFCLFMPEVEKEPAMDIAGRRCVMSAYHTVMLDLCVDEETLLNTQDGKWRNRLRAAEKSDLRVEPVGLKPAQYSWLLEEEVQQSARIGYAALTPALVPIWQENAGKNSLHILKAVIGKETVAGMICLMHGHSATYHIGYSNTLGKKLGAHNLLMWEMIKQLKSRGIKQFDLGGVNTEEDGEGIARFKIGTGGRVVSLCGTYL